VRLAPGETPKNQALQQTPAACRLFVGRFAPVPAAPELGRSAAEGFGVEASHELFAISYQVLPELRQVVVAWEQRALLAAVGVHLISRLHCLPPAPELCRSAKQGDFVMRKGFV